MHRTLFAAAALALAAGSAGAVTFTETTDAGVTPDTATVLPAGTTSVAGTIVNTTISDVDLYKFTLDSATRLTIRGIFPNQDANLLLFNGLGQGIAANDDFSVQGDGDIDGACDNTSGLGDLDSCLSIDLDAGMYFIGFGDNNTAAFENESVFQNGNPFSNLDFFDDDFGFLSEPTTAVLGLIGAETGPDDINDEGPYTLEFSEALGGGTAIPLPAGLPLALTGLAALWAVRRRR
ncbi:MAG: VPLPA-CTERM sorting domain-containing protein [Paracoccaceae bacterium]